uniref:Probable E3 ubiquitin-protein ligase ARI7 n=2 Tax=Mastacembelus armatus TaxID=205130 RepID=A0A3Q3MRP7_9TELE
MSIEDGSAHSPAQVVADGSLQETSLWRNTDLTPLVGTSGSTCSGKIPELPSAPGACLSWCCSEDEVLPVSHQILTLNKPKLNALLSTQLLLLVFHRGHRQRQGMSSNLATTQEKCYDPRDSSLKFVDREDVLDFLCEGFTSRRALMSCGHAVTPTSLTNWCRKLLDEGESRFLCGQFGCDVEWTYDEVRKMALLTPEETAYFEKAIASNAASGSSGAKVCPGCKSVIVRQDESDLCVCCSVCTAIDRQTFKFCWQCLREWKGPSPRSDRCENDGCSSESLKTLQICPRISIWDVKGRCPSIRACPTCGAMLEHDRVNCRYVTCPRCKASFCFACLNLSKLCLTSVNHSKKCRVVPVQTSIPVWHKK